MGGVARPRLPRFQAQTPATIPTTTTAPTIAGRSQPGNGEGLGLAGGGLEEGWTTQRSTGSPFTPLTVRMTSPEEVMVIVKFW